MSGKSKKSVFGIVSKGSLLEFMLVILMIVYFVITTNYISVKERGEHSILVSLIGFIALVNGLFVGSMDLKNSKLNFKTLYFVTVRVFGLGIVLSSSYMVFSEKLASIDTLHVILVSVFTATLISLNSLLNLFLYKQEKYFLFNYAQLILLLSSLSVVGLLSTFDVKIINVIYINLFSTQVFIFIILLKNLDLDNKRNTRLPINYKVNINLLIQDITMGSIIRFAPFVLNFFIGRHEIGLIRIVNFFVEMVVKYTRLLLPFQRNFVIKNELTREKYNFFRFSSLLASLTAASFIFLFKENIVSLLFGTSYTAANNYMFTGLAFSVIWCPMMLKINHVNILKSYPSSITIVLLLIVVPSYLLYVIRLNYNEFMLILSTLSVAALVFLNHKHNHEKSLYRV